MDNELTQQLLDALIRQNQLLEGIDWKLWEMYNIMKPDTVDEVEKTDEK